MSRKYQLRTLGCKVNQYESQQLREILESHGLRPAKPGELADLAVVNGCAVTGTASAKTRQAVRRLSRDGYTPVIVVGCGAADSDRLGRIPGVVAVWSHQDDLRRRLRSYLVHRLGTGPDPNTGHSPAAITPGVARSRAGGDDEWMSPSLPAGAGQAGRVTDTNPFIHNSIARRGGHVNETVSDGAPIRRFDEHVRAFLKVQDGCDAFCTYCIVPRLRPVLRSKPVEAVLAEAEGLVQAGHREIVLTGVCLGAYGRPTAVRRQAADGPHPLAKLVEALAGIKGLVRLRLSSLEPKDVDDHLLRALASHDCCVPHLHLPLQAGSSRVLRRMNRQYDAEGFEAMVQRVERALDRPAISTDILVGFPGETEADFECTLDVARRVGFCKIHAFPFSPRANTAAARWARDFVDGSVVHQRMGRLREIERQTAFGYAEQFVGTVQRVLVESAGGGQGAAGASTLLHGRTDRYFEVWFDAQPGHLKPGQVAFVRVDRVHAGRVRGTLVQAPSLEVRLPVLNDHAA